MSTPNPYSQWRREATTCSSTPRRPRRQEQITLRRAGSAMKTKTRPRTAIARKSDVSESTASTSVSSEGRRLLASEIKYGAERRECIEKCLLWMETLPDKFSGMHIVTPQVVHVDDS